MGRAQQAQVRQQGNTLENIETPNAQTAGSSALAGYQSLYANPGYTPAQQSSVVNATEAGIGAAEGANAAKVGNQVARTGNSAGQTATLDNLARSAMTTGAQAEANNQVTFANAARADRNTALAGYNSLYGTSLGGANSTLGILNNSANQPNAFTSAFEGALGKTLGSPYGNTPSGNFGFG